MHVQSCCFVKKPIAVFGVLVAVSVVVAKTRHYLEDGVGWICKTVCTSGKCLATLLKTIDSNRGIQSNLSNTHTERTERSVRIRAMSV